MKTRQRQESQTSNSKLQIPIIVLVASALLAILLMASILILYSDRKNEVAALRAEIEAFQQEQEFTQRDIENFTNKQELTQRDIASLTDKVESLEKAVSSQVIGDIAALRTDIEGLRRDQMAMHSDIENLVSKVESFKTAKLEKPTSSAEPTTSSSVEVKLDVPRYKQAHRLTCESSAASMVANFYGVSLSEEEIIEALPRDENPNLGFRGRVNGNPGGLTDYGVYANPIREILIANGLEATYVEGGSEEIKRALDRKHPVIAWVTYKLWVQEPVQIALSTGQEVKMVNYEHTVVVTGYNQEGFWVNDPYDGQEYFYGSTDFARAFGYLDNMALEVAP